MAISATRKWLSFLESTFFYFVAWSPTAYRNPPLLPGRTVDVFITTYNEPLDLLRETVVCATTTTDRKTISRRDSWYEQLANRSSAQ